MQYASHLPSDKRFVTDVLGIADKIFPLVRDRRNKRNATVGAVQVEISLQEQPTDDPLHLLKLKCR